MKKKIEKALNKSIKHWERLSKVETFEEVENEGIGAFHCALCKLFDTPEVCRCEKGCPVYEHTGEMFCANTPYPQAAMTYNAIIWDSQTEEEEKQYLIEFKEAALKELLFLKGLK